MAVKQNGYKVATTGYFVYVNGKTDREAFDGKLDFDITIIPYLGNTDWIEKQIFGMKACLEKRRPQSPTTEATL